MNNFTYVTLKLSSLSPPLSLIVFTSSSSSYSFKDLERLYPDERSTVHITLVEANEILSSFDTKLRSYTERLIKKRERMQILKAAVTSKRERKRESQYL